MKRRFPSVIVLAWMGLGSLGAAESELEAVRMRPSHGDLEKRRAEAVRQGKRLPAGLVEVASGGLAKPRQRELKGLVARSTVICFDGFWTIVPKGAVLHIPERLKDRVGGQPGGRLLTWADFFGRNRGWLWQQPVEIGHARGEKALPEEVVLQFGRGAQVVVATCHNGPISMKRPAE